MKYLWGRMSRSLFMPQKPEYTRNAENKLPQKVSMNAMAENNIWIVALHLPPYRTLSNYTPRDESSILCRNWITFQVQPIRRRQRIKWKFTYWMARLPNPSPFHLPSPRRLRALYKRWENSFWRNGIDTKKRQTY